MERIVKILMKRDGVSEDEAQNQFDNAKQELDRLIQNEDTNILHVMDYFCEEHFGLEPDYLDDFLYPGSGDVD